MKRLLFIFLLYAGVAAGQTTTQYLGGPNTLVRNRGYESVDSGSYLAIRDTAFIPKAIGLQVFRPIDGLIYVSISTTAPKKWQKVGSGGKTLTVGVNGADYTQPDSLNITAAGLTASKFDADGISTIHFSIPFGIGTNQYFHFNNDHWEPKQINYSEIAGTVPESDPVFTASPAAGVTAGKITNWDAAYAWGNHAGQYVLLAGTYSNPSWITALDAGKITTGTIAAARLGSGTPSASTVLYGNNTWGALPSFTGLTGTLTTGRIPYASGTSTLTDVSTMTYDPATIRARFPAQVGFGTVSDADFDAETSGAIIAKQTRFKIGDGTTYARMGIVPGSYAFMESSTNHALRLGVNTVGVIIIGTTRNVVMSGTGSTTELGRLTVVGTTAMNGGQRVVRTTVADVNYSVTGSDFLISVTSLTAPRTITLTTGSITASSANPAVFRIKDESGAAGTHTITITPSSGTIDGAANTTITTNYGSKTIYYNGTNFFTL